MDAQFEQWIDLFLAWLSGHGLRVVGIIIGSVIVYYIGKRFVARIVRFSVVRDAHHTEEAEKQREDTLIRIFDWVMRVILMLVAFMMVLQEMGISIGPLLAGAGIAGIAIGFGGQYLIRDYLTGFFMILENQYRIGDWVRLDQTSGEVEDISLRMTTLRDMDGTVHHVPHGDVKRVSNESKFFARINLNIAVSYTSDLERVIEVVNRVGHEMAAEETYKASFFKAPQFLRVNEITPAAMVIKVVGETAPKKQWELAGELRKRLLKAFEREGIEFAPSQILMYTNPQPPLQQD